MKTAGLIAVSVISALAFSPAGAQAPIAPIQEAATLTAPAAQPVSAAVRIEMLKMELADLEEENKTLSSSKRRLTSTKKADVKTTQAVLIEDIVKEAKKDLNRAREACAGLPLGELNQAALMAGITTGVSAVGAVAAGAGAVTGFMDASKQGKALKAGQDAYSAFTKTSATAPAGMNFKFTPGTPVSSDDISDEELQALVEYNNAHGGTPITAEDIRNGHVPSTATFVLPADAADKFEGLGGFDTIANETGTTGAGGGNKVNSNDPCGGKCTGTQTCVRQDGMYQCLEDPKKAASIAASDKLESQRLNASASPSTGGGFVICGSQKCYTATQECRGGITCIDKPSGGSETLSEKAAPEIKCGEFICNSMTERCGLVSGSVIGCVKKTP